MTLNNITKQKAESIKKALEPDNVNFPDGLDLTIESTDSKLVFIFYNSGNVKKLIGTIDEVLSHIQVVLKVIE